MKSGFAVFSVLIVAALAICCAQKETNTTNLLEKAENLPEGAAGYCRQPPNKGTICSDRRFAEYTFFYFNASTQQCEEFAAGSCSLSILEEIKLVNRFRTKKQCYKKCFPGKCVADCSNDCLFGKEEDENGCETCKCKIPCKSKICADDEECYVDEMYNCTLNGCKFEYRAECQKRFPELLVVCGRPVHREICADPIAKWYYNTTNGQCVEFQYGGCSLNGNHFSSKSKCESWCNNVQNSLDQCKSKICADDEECYVDDLLNCTLNGCRREYRAECQKKLPDGVLKACGRPVHRELCADPIASWYYNTTSGQCVEFQDGGCSVNGNRFNRKDECESWCNVQNSPDPCENCSPEQVCFQSHPEKEPVCMGIFPDGAAEKCRRRINRGKSCAPDGEERTQWYFNVETRQCEEFSFRGCSENSDENRFFTKQSCYRECFPGKCVVTECSNYCYYGREEDENGCETCDCKEPCKSTYCPGGECFVAYINNCTSNGCKLDYLGVCQKKLPMGVPEVCGRPAQAGSCMRNDSKVDIVYYFNSDSGRCEELYHKRCAYHNKNFFYTKSFCEDVCKGANMLNQCKKIRCELERCLPYQRGSKMEVLCLDYLYFKKMTLFPKKPFVCGLRVKSGGIPREVMNRWYYNTMSDECEEFIYGGIDGNGNNFVDKLECEKTCKPRNCQKFQKEVMCLLHCQHGFETDKSGCPTCKCKNPCKNINCHERYCKIKETNCDGDQCIGPFKPVCVFYEYYYNIN